MKIALSINGKYMSAENGGDDVGIVHANRSAIGPWETWTLEIQPDGSVALRSVNGRYLSAELGGGADVHANRLAVGPWEKWQLIRVGEGVNFRSDNGHFLSARLDMRDIPVNAIAAGAGPWETFTLTVVESDIVRVHVEGPTFVDELGRGWIWKGCTDFLLFKQHLDGQDVTPLLRDRASAGANLVRVLGMAQNITRFRPQEYPDYFDRLGPFMDLVADNGLYVELTVFADAQLIMSSSADQHQHLDRVVSVVRGKSNVFVELVNEYSKNGVDPRLFNKPDGVLCSRGSGQTDEAPPQPPWDYITFHARRDPPKAWNDVNPDNVRWPPGPPWVTDEMMKAGVDVSDPSRFFQAGIFAGLANGATFHSQEGVESRPFGPVARACAMEFFRGLKSIAEARGG
jgi:hypothetical protein